MIKQLKIKDYILIDELTVNFDGALNVITGETGAGKSIIINAIDLVLGARASREVIKTGAEKAVIELVIQNDKHDLTKLFDENGIDNWGTEIVVSKEITQTGSRSRVNGTLVGADFIKVLKDIFLDIHSQHQTYSYLQPKFHITLLDAYAKDFYGEELSCYQTLWNEYQTIVKQLDEAKSLAVATESQIDFMKFQINEIEALQIEDETEDEKLTAELSVLENAEKLKELTSKAYWSISNDDNSVLAALEEIKFDVTKAAQTDANLDEVRSALIEASELLKESGSRLRDYSQNLENDTARLNSIQERLFELDKVKRKYGGTLQSVLQTLSDLKKQYSAIEFSTKNIDELSTKLNEIRTNLMQQAQILSQKRKICAEKLSALIVEKLEVLELPKVRFAIDIKPQELSATGIDGVEFMISTNISEDLKPLAKVASGGEVSRVMLAIKSIFAQNDDIDTVIFDEIDTGVSGKTSQSVADEIKTLAKYRQIILITHQAIIASKADKHFYVKKVQGETTQVGVYVLEGENKVMALAELAGGDINEQSLEFARSLID